MIDVLVLCTAGIVKTPTAKRYRGSTALPAKVDECDY